MSERKWKVGGKYRLVDVKGFNNSAYINQDIVPLIKGKDFIVESVGKYGWVYKISGEDLSAPPAEFWFHAEEIKYFTEVVSIETDKSPVENTAAVVEWLDKLAYVIVTDTSVGSRLEINLRDQAVLETYYGDIIGNQNVVEFINNRYSQLTEQANKAKRESLLVDIVKAKEAYEALVGELTELEGK